MPFDFDEKQVREDLAAHEKDGVRLESFRSEVVDGWKYADLALSFQTVEGLTRTPFLPRKGVSLTALGDGRYAWRQQAGRLAPPPVEGADPAAVEQMMAELMKGFRAELRVEVPGEIVDSSADEVKGRTAIWRLDLEKDPAALKRAQELDLRVVFRGDGLNLPEFGASPP